MADRTLIALALSALIGVGVSFNYILHQPDTLHYRIAPAPTPLEYFTVPSPSAPRNQEQIKNKQRTQARIARELGQVPRIRAYRTQTRKLSDKDFHCLALNIYHEARGESLAGMIAVAQITLNRVDLRYRGQKTVCRVVYDPRQFSWTQHIAKHQKTPTGASWSTATLAAQKAVEGVRIAGLEDSLHYHADWIPHPGWSLKMTLNHVIGQHVYLKGFPS